jgi:REP element-mobilizing transposase RayT
LANAPVTFEARQRLVVHRTICEVCDVRQWTLLALNVRTNHVHVVLSGTSEPEAMMTTLKAWATRRLREAQLVPIGDCLWSRHGSTKYLWNGSAVEAACAYVRDQSGERDAQGPTG